MPAPFSFGDLLIESNGSSTRAFATFPLTALSTHKSNQPQNVRSCRLDESDPACTCIFRLDLQHIAVAGNQLVQHRIDEESDEEAGNEAGHDDDGERPLRI